MNPVSAFNDTLEVIVGHTEINDSFLINYTI
jgi:hypothetical protein